MSVATRRRLSVCLEPEGGAGEARIALLAMLLTQDRSTSRLIAALRSTIPLVRQEAAAALALIGAEHAMSPPLEPFEYRDIHALWTSR